MATSVLLSHETLSTELILSQVRDPACGGISLFSGETRNHNRGKVITHLEFEAYGEMALKEMAVIADDCLKNYDIEKIAIHHRTGKVSVGEIAVLIAASAHHRDAAFKAVRYAIDTLKETVPIWKKEFTDDGYVWINAHP